MEDDLAVAVSPASNRTAEPPPFWAAKPTSDIACTRLSPSDAFGGLLCGCGEHEGEDSESAFLHGNCDTALLGGVDGQFSYGVFNLFHDLWLLQLLGLGMSWT